MVQIYRRKIFGTVHRLIGRPDDVEDVAQEVFVRLYFSMGQLRSAEVFESWLYRLTVNACYDYLRKQKRRPESRMSDLSEQAVLMADAEAATLVEHDTKEKSKVREFVNQLLGEVSEEDRLLLTMKEVEGLSLKQLGEIYRVNENAMKVRLFRARQRVIKAFNKLESSGLVQSWTSFTSLTQKAGDRLESEAKESDNGV